MRSRSRSKHRRYGSGSSARARLPAPTGRVAPGASDSVERVLALLAPQHAATDERRRVGVRVPDDQLLAIHLILHGPRVPAG